MSHKYRGKLKIAMTWTKMQCNTFFKPALWARNIDLFRYLQSISRMPPYSLCNIILQDSVSSRGLVVFLARFRECDNKGTHLGSPALCRPNCFSSLHIAWFAWLLPSLLLALLHFAASSLLPSPLHVAASFPASLLPSLLHIAASFLLQQHYGREIWRK